MLVHLCLVHAAARYLLDNREVQIEWQYATEPGGQAEMAGCAGSAALETPRKNPIEMWVKCRF